MYSSIIKYNTCF